MGWFVVIGLRPLSLWFTAGPSSDWGGAGFGAAPTFGLGEHGPGRQLRLGHVWWSGTGPACGDILAFWAALVRGSPNLRFGGIRAWKAASTRASLVVRDGSCLRGHPCFLGGACSGQPQPSVWGNTGLEGSFDLGMFGGPGRVRLRGHPCFLGDACSGQPQPSVWGNAGLEGSFDLGMFGGPGRVRLREHPCFLGGACSGQPQPSVWGNAGLEGSFDLGMFGGPGRVRLRGHPCFLGGACSGQPQPSVWGNTDLEGRQGACRGPRVRLTLGDQLRLGHLGVRGGSCYAGTSLLLGCACSGQPQPSVWGNTDLEGRQGACRGPRVRLTLGDQLRLGHLGGPGRVLLAGTSLLFGRRLFGAAPTFGLGEYGLGRRAGCLPRTWGPPYPRGSTSTGASLVVRDGSCLRGHPCFLGGACSGQPQPSVWGNTGLEGSFDWGILGSRAGPAVRGHPCFWAALVRGSPNLRFGGIRAWKAASTGASLVVRDGSCLQGHPCFLGGACSGQPRPLVWGNTGLEGSFHRGIFGGPGRILTLYCLCPCRFRRD